MSIAGFFSALNRSDKQKPGSGNTLNLSAASLSAKTCAILAKLFETDRSFTDIRFNDCSLSDEGLFYFIPVLIGVSLQLYELMKFSSNKL
jgi:Ran GTPase-activating protein (RanGAP) involved in mRNA processing and transport